MWIYNLYFPKYWNTALCSQQPNEPALWGCLNSIQFDWSKLSKKQLQQTSYLSVFWYIHPSFALTQKLYNVDQGGLAARSGTGFTWSPQLRNLAEWDWVPFSFKPNMAENADMEVRWVFAPFWVFLLPNIKKRFSRTFLMKFLDIRSRDVRTVHGWLHLAWFGISASSVI